MKMAAKRGGIGKPPELRVPWTSPLARICGEVNSKCASLSAASRLLPDLPVRDSREMLRLMVDAARRLAKSLETHRQEPR
jgi:hypothetical protein